MSKGVSLERITTIFFFVFLNAATILSLSQFNTEGIGRLVIRLLIICSAVAVILNYIQLRKIKLSALFLIGLLFVVSILSYASTGGFGLLMLMLLCLITKGMDINQVLKYNISTLFIGFIIIVATSILGITDMTFRDVMKNDVMITVYRLGFGNPNSAPAAIFSIITGYNIIRNLSLTKKELLVELGIAYLVFYIFGSRTCTLVLIGYIIGIFFVQRLNDIKVFKLIMYPFQYFFLFCTFLMLYVSFNYNSIDATWYDLNFLFSGRLYTWKSLVDYYGINLFGNDMSTLSEGLDNGYLYLLMYSGIISLFIYNYIFLKASKAAFSSSNWILFITILAYSIYGFFESTPLFGSICNILLVFGWLILRTEVQSNTKVNA